MGSSQTDKQTKEKEPKTPASTISEQPSATSTGTVNPEWSGFQAYSPIPPHGFIASSPQAHPYMWGVQHIMPPYGTPPHPYVAMYPPGGIYTHPSIPPGSYPFSPFAMASPNAIPDTSMSMPGSVEVDGRPSEVKEKLPIKRSKGSLGSLNMLTGKNSETSKMAGASANGAYSKSAESGSEGSSEGSDADSQNDSQLKLAWTQDSLEAEASQNGSAVQCLQKGGQTTQTMANRSVAVMPMTASVTPGGVPGPKTNLNIGMDYWGAPTSSPITALHGKVDAAPVAGHIVNAGSRDGVQSQLWLQDERELKRQRRKQSNRESARRSRLRKQAECDELAQRAETLKEENTSLRTEVSRFRSEYEQLLSENASLKEKLAEISGHEDVRFGQNGGEHLDATQPGTKGTEHEEGSQ